MMKSIHSKRPAPIAAALRNADDILVERIVELYTNRASADEVAVKMKDLAFTFKVPDPRSLRATLDRRVPNAPQFVDFVMASFLADRKERNNELARTKFKFSKSLTKRDSTQASLRPVSPVQSPANSSAISPLVKLMTKTIEDLVVLVTRLGVETTQSPAELEANIRKYLDTANLPQLDKSRSFEDLEAEITAAAQSAKPQMRLVRKETVELLGNLVGSWVIQNREERERQLRKWLDALAEHLDPESAINKMAMLLTAPWSKKDTNPKAAFEDILALVKQIHKSKKSPADINYIVKINEKFTVDNRWRNLIKGTLTATFSTSDAFAWQWFHSCGLRPKTPASESAPAIADVEPEQPMHRETQLFFSAWSMASKPLSFVEIEALEDSLRRKVIDRSEVIEYLDREFSFPVREAILKLTEVPETVSAINTLLAREESPFCSNHADTVDVHINAQFIRGESQELFSALTCCFARVALLQLDAQHEFKRLQYFFGLKIASSPQSMTFFEGAVNVVKANVKSMSGNGQLLAQACFAFMPKLPADTMQTTCGGFASMVANLMEPTTAVSSSPVTAVAPMPSIPSALLQSFTATSGSEGVVQDLCNILARTQDAAEIASLARQVARCRGVVVRELKSFDAFLTILVMRASGINKKEFVESAAGAFSKGLCSP